MERLLCARGDENTIFYVEESHGFDVHKMMSQDLPWQQLMTWQYRVYRSDPPDRHDDFYEATFIQIDQITVLCTELYAHNANYLHKGITPQVFAKAAKDIGKTIISSTTRESMKRFARESRSRDATTAWERLRQSGRATYNSEEDRYIYMPE